jgi:hypothetical protein
MFETGHLHQNDVAASTAGASMDWFERITGFAERAHADTQAALRVDGNHLVNHVTGRRFGMGHLQVVSLAELRRQVGVMQPSASTSSPPTSTPTASALPRIAVVRGDVRDLHLDPAYAGALFQVASQFNLLEMVGPTITPDDGVTRYAWDNTQGPACAMAAGAGTIYRNYLAPVGGGIGQTGNRQIDTLAELGQALGHNTDQPLWHWRNGYALCSSPGLRRIRDRLAGTDDSGLDALRGLLRIGLHWDVEVTDTHDSPGPLVSQAYCSALPVAYGEPAKHEWEPFARLVLEAAYEATLLAGVLNLRRGASPQVLLTRLGGGAFGNQPGWIAAAIDYALAHVARQGLELLRVER